MNVQTTHKVTLIPGDGIGPEVTAATLRVLDAAGMKFDCVNHSLHLIVSRHDFQLDFHGECNQVVRASKAFPMPFLTAAASNVRNGKASNANLTQCNLYLIQF